MSILNDIIEVKKTEIKELKNKYSFSSFNDFEFFNKPKISFINSIKDSEHLGIIAEIKKASPSRGIIKSDFNHLKIAETYMKAGVNAISILTDKMFFQGDIQFLKDVAQIKEVPLLRKDFIIDEYQVLEAKANGADFILLICECLTKSQINELSNAAYEFGLDVLLELHSEDELEKIDYNTNKLIGINNRDLKTFNVNLDTTLKIRNLLPEEVKVISESGFHSKTNIDHVKNYVDGFLIGEHFMKSDDMKNSINLMKEWCSK